MDNSRPWAATRKISSLFVNPNKNLAGNAENYTKLKWLMEKYQLVSCARVTKRMTASSSYL